MLQLKLNKEGNLREEAQKLKAQLGEACEKWFPALYSNDVFFQIHPLANSKWVKAIIAWQGFRII